MNDELIQEVDHAMQQERWHALWRQYGKFVTYGCVVIVLLAAAMVYWRDQNRGAREHQTSLLLEARNLYASERYGEAKETLDELKAEATGDMRAIAYLWLAKLQLTVDKQEQAIESLASIIAENKEASPLVMLGCMQGFLLAPDDARFVACMSRESSMEALTNELLAVDKTLKGEVKEAVKLVPDTSMLPVTQRQRITDLNAYLSSSVDADFSK